MKPERWTPCGVANGMSPDHLGRYVKFSAYEQLEKERDNARHYEQVQANEATRLRERAEAAEEERDYAHREFKDRALDAEAKLEEYEGKMESGYAFCHPCDDCTGLRAATRYSGELDLARDKLAEAEERVKRAETMLTEIATMPSAMHYYGAARGLAEAALSPKGETDA